MQRVDLPALTRSLSGQIAHAYLDQNPQFKKLLSIEQGFVGSVGAGAADALLREALTPENIAALLNKGRAGFPNAGASIWRMPPLSEAFRTGPLQALKNSYFDGPLSFVVELDGAEGRYNVHLHLSGTTWRLSGLDIPEEISARLAREIAERVRRVSRAPGRVIVKMRHYGGNGVSGDMIRIPHINPSALRAAFSPACPGGPCGRASSRPSR